MTGAWVRLQSLEPGRQATIFPILSLRHWHPQGPGIPMQLFGPKHVLLGIRIALTNAEMRIEHHLCYLGRFSWMWGAWVVPQPAELLAIVIDRMSIIP